jgi:hypothetical protein
MHALVYDASPPREGVSSAAQTHHGAASAAQSTAGAAAQMEKGGASERTPTTSELGTCELGTVRQVLATDTSRQPKNTMNGMTVVNSGSLHDAASAAQTPDAADGAKSKKKERSKNWTKESLTISVLAMAEANERAPEQSYVDRAAHAAAAYKCIALAVAQDPQNNKYGIKPSDTWVANVLQDIADCISASAAGNNRKGQTSRILRQVEVIRTVCNNTINGIYKQVLSPDGQIPTGKQAAEVVEEVRQGLYKVENPTKDTQVPDGWSTIAFDMWVLFGPILIGGRGVSFLQATVGELAGSCSFSR